MSSTRQLFEKHTLEGEAAPGRVAGEVAVVLGVLRGGP
jgi:hypothetical protein